MYICVPKQDSKSFLVDLNLLWASCKPPSTIGKSAGVKWTCGEMFPMLSGSLFHSIFFKQAKALHIQPGLSDSLQADTLGMSTKRIGAPNFPTNPFRNALELKQEVRGSFLPPGCYSSRNWGSTYWSGSPTLSSYRLPWVMMSFSWANQKLIFIKGFTIQIIQIYIQMNILSMQNTSVFPINLPIMRGPSKSYFSNHNFNKIIFLFF